MQHPRPTAPLALAALLAVLALVMLAYRPGLQGPFVFDDQANILDNPALQITELSAASLGAATGGAQAGPLGRPLAYMSFALDYWRTGGAPAAADFKRTNLAIHLLNALLVFVLSCWIGGQIFVGPGGTPAGGARDPRVQIFALAAAAIWALHPIQLTSVLYVVQRMTSLSGTFTLLALLGYLHARTVAGHGLGRLGSAALVPPAAAAAMLTKEIGALLPLYVLALELTVLGGLAPWPTLRRRWRRLSPAWRRLATLGGALLLAGACAAAAAHFSGGYGARPFTLAERLLTEARVLWFYLGLVVAPGLDRFGLHHDDIVLSSGWFAPLTTAPAVLGILLLGGLAMALHRRAPLVALAGLWFLLGHSLESTVVPLEIAHEHRNYLPLLGPCWLLAAGLLRLAPQHDAASRVTRPAVAVVGVLAILAALTGLRADQWSDERVLTEYEARHHPHSARAQNALAAQQFQSGQLEAALDSAKHAERLAPFEPGYAMNVMYTHSVLGQPVDEVRDRRIRSQLQAQPATAFTQRTLQRFGDCTADGCAALAPQVEGWLRARLAGPGGQRHAATWLFLLGHSLHAQGRDLDALNVWQDAHEADRGYLHPLFEMGNLLLEQGQIEGARLVLRQIEAANARAPVPRSAEAAQLRGLIAAAAGAPQTAARP